MKNLIIRPRQHLMVLAFLGAACLPGYVKAQTDQVTVDGTTYDISLVEGTYDSLTAQLDSQPWWDNQTLATEAAAAVGDFFDIQQATPNEDFGPYFAYDVIGSIAYVETYNTSDQTEEVAPAVTGDRYFAVVSTVPEAARTLPLLILSLAALALAACRSKRAHA